MIYNAPSIYNQGGGGGGYKDGGELIDGDFIKVENNTISSYDNVSRDPVNFYFEVKDGEVVNSIVELTTVVNATINVYILKDGLYYLLGNVGGDTVTAGNDYNVCVTGNSYLIENVLNNSEDSYANINGELYQVKKINNLLWTIEDYKKIVGSKMSGDGDPYFMGPATRTATGTNLYNRGALNLIDQDLSDGWRIPSLNDFSNLFEFVGGTGPNFINGVGNQIKKVGAWQTDLGITNSSGFSSVPTGRYDDGTRKDEDNAFYWTSTDKSGGRKDVIYVQDSVNNSYVGGGDEYYDYYAVRFCKPL